MTNTYYKFQGVRFKGGLLQGTTNSIGQRYYKPYQNREVHRYQINADVIETAILKELIDIIVNKKTFMKAILEDNPISKISEDLITRKRAKVSELKSVEKRISSLLKAIENSDGVLNQSKSISVRLVDLEGKDESLRKEIELLSGQLKNLPSEKELETKRNLYKNELKRAHLLSYVQTGIPLKNLSFDRKREIIRLFFHGEDIRGKKYGIYIKHLGGKPRTYRYEAYGQFGNMIGILQSRGKNSAVFSDTDLWIKDNEELSKNIVDFVLESNPELVSSLGNKNKQHMLSECHAYHRIRFH